MTIANTKVKDVYVADGVNRNWEWTFPVLSVDDLQLIMMDKEGTETEVKSGYERDDLNKRFIYPVPEMPALPEGTTVIVRRITPMTQQLDLVRRGPLDAESLESSLDKLTMEVQEVHEAADRAIKFPIGEPEPETSAQAYLNKITNTRDEAVADITQAKDEAVAAGEEAVEAAKDAADQAQEAAGQVQGAVSELTGYVLAAESAKTAAQAAAQNANEAAGAAQGAAEEAAQKALAQSKAYTDVKTGEVRELVSALQLVKFVSALPETGESKYLYAVPQDEKTLDGENIVLLFVWNDTDGWATVGVQTTAVDLSEYAKQADLTAEASARQEADQALDTAVSAKYGPDNLTAGAGVEIKEYTVPTLIDAHTLAVFKFEDTAVPAENSVAEGAVFANRGGSADEATAAYGAKFGAGAFRCAGSNVSGWLRNSDSIPNADYTVDFWVKWGNSGRAGVCTGVNSDAPTGRGVIFYKNKLALPQAAGTGYINKDSVFDTAYDGAVWHHVAYEQKGHAYRVYIDGVQVAQGEYTSFGSQSELYIWGWGGVLIDEVRVSDIARYDGDFTPNTQPYAYAAHKQYEITAKASGAGLPLLSVHWSDHLLNRMDMLRADTFSWQDGTVYTAAYNELLTEYNNAAGADETDGSISFKRTPKGYKICAADQHDNVSALYDSTGVAWYYILDVPNQRFKLPRTKFGFTGLRTGAGNYVAPGLPNITGTLETIPVSTTVDGKGAFRRSTTPNTVGASAGGASWSNVTFDASLSNPTYGNSTTVQPPATEMYLYFFVGNYTQTAIEQTAGLNAEMFNGKADVEALNGKANTDLANVASNIDYVVESYSDNDGNWYRVWKSKRVEQGGVTALIPPGTGVTITFFKEFANISYTIISTPYGAYSNTGMANNPVTQKLTTSFNQASGSTPSASFSWYACGQGAE